MLRKERLEAVFCSVCGERIAWTDLARTVTAPLICDSCAEKPEVCECCEQPLNDEDAKRGNLCPGCEYVDGAALEQLRVALKLAKGVL